MVFNFYSAPTLHKQKVEDICQQIKDHHKSYESEDKKTKKKKKKKKKLCTARGGWQSISFEMRTYKQKAKGISINLYDIIEFNEKDKTVTVEPMVNMGQISKFLIPKGYTLPVIPELDDLTVGGLYMGVGIETSSHKYGLFNDTVVSAEIVSAKGEVVKCSSIENRDLFDALPWSYGTLGFLTAVTIRVVPCKPFVKLWYVPTYSSEASTRVFQAAALKKKNVAVSPESFEKGKEEIIGHSHYFENSAAEHEFDFVESLMYSRDMMMTMPAVFVDAETVQSSKRNRIGLWYNPWFFKHVESLFGTTNKEKGNVKDQDIVSAMESVKGGEQKSIIEFLDNNFAFEFIPLRDYYHRHTRSIFWELQDIIPFGNHFLVRCLLGWALPPKVSFLKLTQTQKIKDLYERSHILQDMMVPFSSMNKSLDVYDTDYQIYPLWICPYRAYDYGALNKRVNSKSDGNSKLPHRCFLKKPLNVLKGECYEMYVDLGAYGTPKSVKDKKEFDVIATSKKMEKFVASVHGFQMLYATSYQEREEFRQMFDHTLYDKMKAVYDPDNDFPQIYDKVCKKASKIWEQYAAEANK